MLIDSDGCKIYELNDIADLEPAFDGYYGWLDFIELVMIIDPNCDRYDVLSEANFIDGSTFALVRKL